MNGIKKRYFGKAAAILILLAMLFTILPVAYGAPGGPPKAAPAIANELLKDVTDLQYPRGWYISQVAKEMGPGATFRGVDKSDSAAYREAVEFFLFERLNLNVFSSMTVSASLLPEGEKVDVLIGFAGVPNRGIVQAFGGDVYAEFSLVDVIAARMTPQQANALRNHPVVSYVEPDAEVYAIGQTVPWGIDRVFDDETYAFPTWSESTGEGIGVAVLDTGIDLNHEDLTVVGGRRFYIQGIWLRSDNNYNDGHGHGTHVAGTIAALDNSVGVVGVAPTADLYAVKVLGDNGSGSTSAIIAGIEWAVAHENIHIINMSLGSNSYNKSFEDACQAAYDAGLLVVSSAGNSGNEEGTGDNVGYPARYASVIAVAASDASDQRAYFSSTGPDVELIAPGRFIESTVPGGYATYSGTSMASPHVAGVAALVWAADRDISNGDVRSILTGTAEKLKDSVGNNLPLEHQGHGMVRADRAVAAVAGSVPVDTGNIAGTVTSGGLAISGASVVVDGTNFSATTNGSGAYVISDVPVGDYNITASTVGYVAQTKSVIVINDATTTKNFDLEADVPDLRKLTTAVNGSGGTTDPEPGVYNYEYNTVVNLEAIPADGYKFDKWVITGQDDVTTPETTITMNSDKTATAYFSAITTDGILTVAYIDYDTSGGKNQDRHLHVIVTTVDGSGNPVSNTTVAIELKRDRSIYGTSTGTTGSNGKVTFDYNNALNGTYTVIITSATADGLVWDKVTPANSFTK